MNWSEFEVGRDRREKSDKIILKKWIQIRIWGNVTKSLFSIFEFQRMKKNWKKRGDFERKNKIPTV